MPFSKHLSANTKKILASKVMVPLVGPTCVGKSTLAHLIANTDPAFHAVIPFTTRPKRPEESAQTYTFIGNSKATQSTIQTDLANGTILQVTTHPTTGYCYGTTIADYAGEYNILPLLSSEVYAYKAAGFKHCPVIMIVTPPMQWQERFLQRAFALDDAKKRIKEAIQSLEWGLGQGNAVCWVANPNGSQTEAAHNIIAYARNNVRQDNNAKAIAQQLVTELQQMTI